MAQQTRKDPRAKVLSMTVRYESATLDEFIEHHSHDVSRGGMFIKTPQPFPPGTLLKFEVRIAEDRKVMQGVGRVVWKRDLTAADAERPAGMGVKFIKLDDDSRRLIDQLLSTRRDEVSAFDAEGSQPGVDTEVPVGLGTDPLSMPVPKFAPQEPSFFPKGKPAELPPPEDRTVMKQATELLEEAMREVSSDEPAAAKPPPLSPAGTDEKEDTKPGRPSRSGDSVGRLPAPKMPRLKDESDAPGLGAQAPAVQRVEAVAASTTAPVSAKAAVGVTVERAGKAGSATAHAGASDLASAAKGITDKARAISTSKAPASTSAKPTSARAPLAKAVPVVSKTAPAASKSTEAQASVPESARGSGRAVFWFLAVAVCATATWWIWRLPPAELPSTEAPAGQVESPAKPVENAVATAAAVEPAPAVVDAAAAEPPAASAAASANVAPEPSAPVPPVPVVAEPTPVAKVVAPPPVTRAAAKPKAVTTTTTTEAPAVAAEPAPAATPEAAPAKEAPVEAKPVEAKSAAPEPAAKAPTAEAPIAPFPPPGTKKRKTPAVDTDNPY